MMHADRYFAIGATHPICQDYALANNSGGRGSVYVADGCSTSPATDFGARFLTLAALRHGQGTRGWDKAVISAASGMAIAAGLPTQCLDSTLLGIVPNGAFVRAFAYGDGVISYRLRESGAIFQLVIDCAGGAPDYLSYRLDSERKQTYLDFVNRLDADAKTRTVREHGRRRRHVCTCFEPVVVEVSPQDVDLVAVLSDGVQSFQRTEEGKPTHIPVDEVLDQVMAVKNTTGDFVVRRVRNGFLNRYCKKNGWTHYDDFSVGMVALGEAR